MTTFTVLYDGLGFLESARWHDGGLYFVDISHRRVLRGDPDGNPLQATQLPFEPTGIGFDPAGHLLVASRESATIYRVADGRPPEMLSDLTSYSYDRLNDSVTDATGRTYVGLASHDRDRTTALALARPDGTNTIAADDIHFPNGVGVTADGSTLILAETLGHRLLAFDIDAPTGDLANRRTFAQFDAGVYPDGICLDSEGGVWVANPVGREVIRVSVAGEITDRFAFEDVPLACVLGGKDRSQLFVVTVTRIDVDALRDEPGGKVHVATTSYHGAGFP